MRVLIVKEKYGNIYLDASDDEQLSKVCLSLLTYRLDSGEYYFEDEDFDGFIERAKKCIEQKNGKKAYSLLMERNDYEYEEIELVEVLNDYLFGSIK